MLRRAGLAACIVRRPHAIAALAALLAVLIARPSTSTAQPAPPPPVVSGSQSLDATVFYSLGWNLVGGPADTVMSGNIGPLYTFQAGNSSYQTVPNGAGLLTGEGYWAYFQQPARMTLHGSSTASTSIRLPPGQWVLIGNPSTSLATLSGADAVYAYDPDSGAYAIRFRLGAGEGAWAFSARGGTVTLRGLGDRPTGSVTNLTATVLSSTSVRLDWVNSASNAEGVLVFDSSAGGDVQRVDAQATSALLVGLQPNSHYCALVYAFNEAGATATSNQACIDTPPS